jgi:hypothetical protein
MCGVTTGTGSVVIRAVLDAAFAAVLDGAFAPAFVPVFETVPDFAARACPARPPAALVVRCDALPRGDAAFADDTTFPRVTVFRVLVLLGVVISTTNPL